MFMFCFEFRRLGFKVEDLGLRSLVQEIPENMVYRVNC